MNITVQVGFLQHLKLNNSSNSLNPNLLAKRDNKSEKYHASAPSNIYMRRER
jgi:hypothetical protein